MSLRDRLERLEARHGAGEYVVPLYMDVFVKELENVRRREAGLEELPYTGEEREYRRAAAHGLLEEYIPHLMREEGSEESRALAAQLEAHVREKIEEYEGKDLDQDLGQERS